MSIVQISDADHSAAGGKAAPLAELTRAGFTMSQVAVPRGFVVPATAYRAAASALGLTGLSSDRSDEARSRILQSRLPDYVVDDVARALQHLTDEESTDYVAVRSSSTAEDAPHASSAGQHDSVLAVRGVEQVCRAILTCWASLWTERAAAYRASHAQKAPAEMAVIVQRFVDAEVSGVMFTGPTSVIEASWGIGEGLVSGQISPDSWRVSDSGIVGRRRALATERTDRHHERLVTRPTTPAERDGACLTDRDVLRLHALGADVSTTLGGPRDIEWAMTEDTTWILQARPVTAVVPDITAPPPAAAGNATPPPAAAGDATLTGVPASPGVATGPVSVIRGPGDFATVRRGDVLVCRHTDPAWTPLFTIASAVVTEVGGVLSHAAIVAREVGIPAVLAVPGATELLTPSSVVTVDGDTGRISR